jgi:hypothetical protein
MKSMNRILSAGALVIVLLAAQAGVSYAQFSQPVIVLKGTVRAEESAKPTSVKVSIREAGDTAREITSSTSNSETGKYLVILKPGKKYWVHLEGDTIMTKDVMVETPAIENTQQIEQDFTVVTREMDELQRSSNPPLNNSENN